jgi:hypothetical protein
MTKESPASLSQIHQLAHGTFPSSKFDDDLDERVVEAGRSAFGFGKRRSFKLAKLNGQDFILPLHLLIFPHWLTLTAV